MEELDLTQILIVVIGVVALIIALSLSLTRRRKPSDYRPTNAQIKRFCPNCNREIPKELKFCPYCGERAILAETITGSGVVEAPNPMKPSITYPVQVHVVGEELPMGIEVEEGKFRETIGLEMKLRGPPIVILGYGEAFDVSPSRREVEVPRRGERSTAVFHITPKASASGTERLFFEYSQGDNFLGVANMTLEISTAGLTRKLVVTVSFPLRIHV